MIKSNRVLLVVGLFIITLAIALIGCFFVFGIQKHNTSAEIGLETPEENNRVESIQYATVQDDAHSYTGGISIHDNNAYVKVCIKYDTTCVSSVSIYNYDASADSGGRSWRWDDASFSVTPASGYSWGRSSISVYVKRTDSSSAYDNPSGYDWSTSSNYSSSWVSFSRSDNTFTYTSGFSGSGSGLRGTIRQTLFVDISTTYMFSNSWAVNPGIDSWTSGQTASNPQGRAAHSSGSVRYTYYNADAYDMLSTVINNEGADDGSVDSLSGKPSTPGKYYLYVSDSGDIWSSGMYSDYILFYIYAPTPTMTTSYTYTGGAITASTSYNSSYVNAPSGVTYTNVGSYTATFTAKSYTESCSFWVVWPDWGEEEQVTYNVTKTVLFNNGTTSYSIGWSITKKNITIPSVSGTFTYDGTQKSATVTNMNSTYITQGGRASATNAGTYTITFTLNDTTNTQWSGGSTAVQNRTWSITQATNSWTSQPSISSWTYGSAPSTVNVGTPRFGQNYYWWIVVNADIFETYYIVDTNGGSTFNLSTGGYLLGNYATSDIETYPIISLSNGASCGNVSQGYDALETGLFGWSYLPSGRYYFYSFLSATSANYTTANITFAAEFYVYAPAPTITNNTPYTYNGNNQGPTISGSTAYYTTQGTTTAKNAGSYGFFILAKYGTDSYNNYTYPYYFSGKGDMDDFLDYFGYDCLAEIYYYEELESTGYAYDITYELKFSVSYTINKASLNGGSITLTPTEYTYDGTVHKP